MRAKLQRGFTLVEIIIVFALIALIGTYMMGTSFISAQQRARDARRKSDLISIAKNLELYVNDHGTYPLTGTLPFGAEWTDGTTIYLKDVPQDARAGRSYDYHSDGIGWQLYARLERDDDPALSDLNNDGQYIPADDDFPAAADCGTNPCNYGISSSNTSLDTPYP